MRLRSCASSGRQPRRGVVLLAVLIVIAVLMLVGYQFYNLMTAEFGAANASNRVAQGRTIADSGLHYAAFVLSYPQNVGLNDAEDSTLVSPILIYHNPSVFQRRPVNAINPRLQGYFSIVAARDPDDPLAGSEPLRCGIEDEGGKINLNTLLRIDSSGRRAREMLQKLPNMTEDIANALLNWVQESGSGESANADSLYYSSMGYQAKHGPYESLEELLLVRGITPRLLLGNDLNRNGIVDPDEDAGGGVIDRGLSRFLTVFSREQNLDAQGQPRTYVNDSDLRGLYDKLTAALGEELATFIIGYRQNAASESSENNNNNSGNNNSRGDGQGNGQGRQASGPPGSGQPGSGQQGSEQGSNANTEEGKLSPDILDFDKSGGSQIESLFELIDADFVITRENRRIRYRSPLQSRQSDTLRELLPLLLDKLTTKRDMNLPARININTAPREVLLALPDLTEEDVQNILDHRPTADMDPTQAPTYRTPAWLITEAGFDAEAVQDLEPYITTRSAVFRVQVVGYFEMGGPSVRLEAVIDTTNGRPQFLYWRDLTELGRGYDPRVLMTLGP